MDYTIREIDNYAKGVDTARRAQMATMLWAAHQGAGFTGFAFAGKRLPNIDQRLQKIMEHGQGQANERRSEVASVLLKMSMIAQRHGLPPPRPRARKPNGA